MERLVGALRASLLAAIVALAQSELLPEDGHPDLVNFVQGSIHIGNSRLTSGWEEAILNASGAKAQDAALNASGANSTLEEMRVVRPPSVKVHMRNEGQEAKMSEESATWDKTHVCVKPEELVKTLKASTEALRGGLPPWPAQNVPAEKEDITLAFLIQVSWESKMPLLKRMFTHIYNSKDIYLFTIDREMMRMDKVLEVLPKPLPENVQVRYSSHADYYVWPRVEIVLQGLWTLLENNRTWDFAIHLSESDYPVHSLDWIRKSLAKQRRTNFMQIVSRCSDRYGMEEDPWNWWHENKAIASCGDHEKAVEVDGVRFPMADLERNGLRSGRGSEWMVVTRELVQYGLSPELGHYRRMIGMHIAADEIFWQTMVLNIPGFDQNISRQGWMIKWGHGKTDHSPDILTDEHEEELFTYRKLFLFIRKVEMPDSELLLNDIDELIAAPDRESIPTRHYQAWDHGMRVCPQPGQEESQGEDSAPEEREEREEREKSRESDGPGAPEERPPAQKSDSQKPGWQGTKSIKQLQDAYKQYMNRKPTPPATRKQLMDKYRVYMNRQ